MQLLKDMLAKLGKLILAEVLQPLDEIKKTQQEQGEVIKALAERVEKLHSVDPIITECDLASLDNQICTRIAMCRERGYTTSEDRRIVGRMHSVYKKRGGNHGEDNEYNVFCALPTEEAFHRAKGVIA